MLPIIVALDNQDAKQVLKFAQQLNPDQCRLKVGKELFTAAGPNIIKSLQQLGFDIFLDLKFHDIPNTTAQAVLAAADMGVWMVNVHAACGHKAMEETMSRLHKHNYTTQVIAVTMLTSMSQQDLTDIGISLPKDRYITQLAELAQQCGLQGVVCSAQEATLLKQHCGSNFTLVTPGIRMAEDSRDDQNRICTPAQALANGADYLVIGRSITQAADPMAKIKQIQASLV